MPFGGRPIPQELDWALATVGYTTSSATGPYFEDIPGAVVEFTVGARPVMVQASGRFVTSTTAGVRVKCRLYDGTVEYGVSQATIVAASEHHPVGLLAARFDPNAGAKVVKLQLGLFSGTGTASIDPGGVGYIWVRAFEV